MKILLKYKITKINKQNKKKKKVLETFSLNDFNCLKFFSLILINCLKNLFRKLIFYFKKN